MSFLKKITEKLFGKPLLVQSPFFGEMIDAESYFECEKYFKPIAREVEIGLEKTLAGGEDRQVDFFNWLENNYDAVIEKISQPIEEKIIEWIPDYRIKDFKKEFKLEYLFIPKCDSAIFDWQISFWAENELQHWCSLEMNGLEVKFILIDG